MTKGIMKRITKRIADCIYEIDHNFFVYDDGVRHFEMAYVFYSHREALALFKKELLKRFNTIWA